MSDLNKDGLINYDEACELLGVSRRALQTMASRRQVPCVRLGARRVRFRRADLEKWIAERSVRPPSPEGV